MIFSRLITPSCIAFGIVRHRPRDAVDPRADDHVVLLRLEVDVGGAVLDRLRERRVDELDRGRVVARPRRCPRAGRAASNELLEPRPRASTTSICVR